MSESGDPEPGVSGSNTPPRKKSKGWYQQSFNPEWLQDPELKDWVKPDPKDKNGAFCSVCDWKLKNCNKSALMKHKASSKHIKCFEAKKRTVNIQQYFKKPTESEKLQDKIAKAELLLEGYIAEHGVPFAQVDHLVEVIKKMAPDCEILQGMKMKKTKASYILQDGIAWEESESVAKICKENKFSLIIDECTDVSVSQVLAVMVRFYDEQKCKVTDALLDVVEVDDASAEGLFKSVKELLKSKDIPLQNIIGFASDNCSKMLGAHKGFQAYLKHEIPSVFILGCVCHSFALCASQASNTLPSWLESFLKDACGYFARSSKRQHLFQMIQDVAQTPKHKMLKLSQTRWLSRGSVVSRILEQWDALQLFFQGESSTDKVDGAAKIHKTMTTPGTKHMLLFLNYILRKVDKMNIEFQSQYFRLSTLYSTISDEYRSILAMFVKKEVLQSQGLSSIDPRDHAIYKKVDDIDLGGRCESMLINEPLGEAEKIFRLDCQKFLVELCAQMRKRFAFEEDSILAMLRVVDPKEALSDERSLHSIVKLAVKFPTLIKEEDLDDLQDEWKDLLHFKESLKNMSDSATNFWHELRTVKDGHSRQKFSLLSNFMCCLLVLPHSSACVERVFSQLNIIKTKRTNSLHVSTVANRLLAKQAIARHETTCNQWEPSTSLIKDVISGKCHQRYISREAARKQREVATLHPDDAEAPSDEEPLPVFLQ